MSIMSEKITIELEANVEIKAGNYAVRFKAIEGPFEGEYDPYLKFIFEDSDGVMFVGCCSDTKPRMSNKYGKWLCALANFPIDKAGALTPIEYVDKEYLLIYTPNEKGTKVTLNTFSKIG